MSDLSDISAGRVRVAVRSVRHTPPDLTDVVALGLTLVIPLAFVLAPWVYPAELLCFFFLQILLAAGLGCLHLWRRRGWAVRLVASAGVALSAGVVFAPVVAAERRADLAPPPADRAACLTVMTVNVLGSNRRAEGLEAEIAARQPDVIILEEATRFWRDRSRTWRDFPYRASSHVRLTDIDVLSRRPLRAVTRPYASDAGGLPVRETVRVEIAGPDAATPVSAVVYALHAETPRSLFKWHARNDLLAALAPRIAEEAPTMPVVVGGDFNTPLWSPALGRFAETAGLTHLGTGPVPFSTRFLLPPLPLVSGAPIDHLFVNAGFVPARAEIGGRFGSDHLPVTATVCPRPAGSGTR